MVLRTEESLQRKCSHAIKTRQTVDTEIWSKKWNGCMTLTQILFQFECVVENEMMIKVNEKPKFIEIDWEIEMRIDHLNWKTSIRCGDTR